MTERANGTAVPQPAPGQVAVVAAAPSSPPPPNTDPPSRVPTVLKVSGIVVGIMATVMTAMWGLASQMSDRPTTEQVEKVFADHADDGHREMQVEIREIKTEQRVQGVIIEQIERKQSEQDRKLDTILERLPAR